MPLDTSIYSNIKPVEMPDMMGTASKAMSLRQMQMQNDNMQSEQAQKAKTQKIMALGQEMEQLAKLPPEQRPGYHAQKQQELMDAGVISPAEAQPYSDENFNKGMAMWRSTPEFAALDKERATAEHLRAEAAKARAEKPDKQKLLAAEQSDKMAGFQSSRSMLGDLRQAIASNGEIMGPVAGRLSSMNPYSPESTGLTALFGKASQIIGKALEGGKLTDQDRIYYQGLLPKQSDTPSTALAKIDQLERMVADQQNAALDTYRKAGLNVSEFANADKGDAGVLHPKKTDQSGTAYAGEKPAATPEDREAISWAQKNFKDPRAKQILKLHGML
jgi:hypothetical protein